nr:hypothetical protein-2 [Brachypodium distachyon]
MATAWVRSLSCKSTAVADDVYSSPKKRPPPAKGSEALLPAWEKPRSRNQRLDGLARTPKPETEKMMKKKPRDPRQNKLAASSSSSSPAAALLAMTELPEGHSSRRVVELIFASGWGADDSVLPEVEALFRVQATARAAARFEDARRAAARSPGADARCAADGNEMMRFQCLAADGNELLCAAVATCRPGSAAVRTFASSGAAHAAAGAGAGEEGEASSRRRGMLVCRVVAGRVGRAEEDGDCDSVDNGGGELVVLDSRAVLPCFLVVYRAPTCR